MMRLKGQDQIELVEFIGLHLAGSMVASRVTLLSQHAGSAAVDRIAAFFVTDASRVEADADVSPGSPSSGDLLCHR